MRTLWSGLMAVLMLAGSLRAQDVLIDTSFADVQHPAATDSPRITGKLPAGWEDNSGWAKVWIDYSVAEQEGRRYLVSDVKKVEDGRAQLRHALARIERESYFRLELVARSPTAQAVEVGVRQEGAPYEFLWQRDVSLVAGWQTLTWDFVLPSHGQDVGLFINQGGAGQLQLLSARLVRYTKEQFLAEMSSKFPGGSPPNLMRHSTFPLGLQTGWNLWREVSDGDEVTIATTESERVPGGASLEVTAKKHFAIYSAPIEIARPDQKHTASLYARGQGTVRLTAFIDGKEVAANSAELKPDEWSRVSVPFEPVLLSRYTVLRIQGGTRTSLDGVQVNAGDQPGELAMRAKAELSLATDSPTRILFDGDPATVRYAIAGGLPAGRLRASVFDVDGREAALPPVAIDGPQRRTGTLDIAVFPDRPLGAFRVEAWLEDESETALSPTSDLVVLRVRQPRHWGQDAPSSPFGVHTLSANRHAKLAKQVGANWVRLHDAGTGYIGWRYLEPEKGKWTFFDDALNRYRQNHLKIVGAFATSPNWASYYPGKEHNGYFDQFYLPKDWADYANYVRVVADRYKGVIDTWDIWNEPWIWSWWAVGYDPSKAAQPWDSAGYVTSEHPERDFATMTRVAAENARAVAPAVQVLGVNSTSSTGFANSMPGKEWTAGIAAENGEANADVYVYHQYSGQPHLFPGDEVETGFAWAMGPLIEKHGKLPKPVWMTEGSTTRTKLGSGLYRITDPQNRENVRQAGDNLVRFVVSLLAHGCEKTFIYSMHSHEYFNGQSDWRVLVNPDGYAHPSAAAYSAMAWLLEDTKFVGRLPAGQGVNVYLFQGPGRAVGVISPVPGSPGRFVVPPGIDAQDLFGNPLKPGDAVSADVAYLVAADAAAIQKAVADAAQ